MKYSVILADPPWRYDHCNTPNRAIENHYATMTEADICALDVASIAAKDAVLFLWSPSPKLDVAMRVIEAWGFTYKTCGVWVKSQLGMGYYFRQRHELILIGVRGKLRTPIPSTRAASVINAPRRKHSQKPDELHAIIEAMYPEHAKIELFARAPRPGWDVWGNEEATSVDLFSAAS